MTRENLIKLWPILEALKDGKQIQYKQRDGVWQDTDTCSPAWEYRIKPEPRVIWVNQGLDGKLRDAVWLTEAEAKSLGSYEGKRPVKFIEVLE